MLKTEASPPVELYAEEPRRTVVTPVAEVCVECIASDMSEFCELCEEPCELCEACDTGECECLCSGPCIA